MNSLDRSAAERTQLLFMSVVTICSLLTLVYFGMWLLQLPSAFASPGKPVAPAGRYRRRAARHLHVTSSIAEGTASVAESLERAIQSGRDAASAGAAEALQFAVFDVTLPYPLPAVMHALRNKYRPPDDPLNPSIKEAELLSERKADRQGIASAFSHVPQACTLLGATMRDDCEHEEATLLVRKIRSGVARWVPSMLRWMLPTDSIRIMETTLYLAEQQVLYSTLVNIDLVSLGSFQDQALYTPCADKPEHTRYRSWLMVKSDSSLGSRAMSFFADPRGEPPKADAIFASHVKVLLARLQETGSRSIAYDTEGPGSS